MNKIGKKRTARLVACRLIGHDIKQVIIMSMDKEEPPFRHVCTTCLLVKRMKRGYLDTNRIYKNILRNIK